MGCSCTREEAKLIISQQVGKDRFFIKLYIPNSNTIKILYYETKLDHISVIELFNLIFFCSKWADEVDANFLSIYNKKKEAFDYKIQRLFGFEWDEEQEIDQGKNWTVYINGTKENLSVLFGYNRIINKRDVIELKYENNI
jgi:hypothetical protein